jgi:hypothetical protein
MPETSKLNLPYPTEGQPQWSSIFSAMMNTVDAYIWCAIENTNLILTGGGAISFVSGTGTLSWDEDFVLISTLSGGEITIPAGSLPGIADGEIFYVTVARPVSGLRELTMSKGTSLGGNYNNVFLGLRRGTDVILRNSMDTIS